MAHAGRAVIDRQGEADAGRSGVTWTPSFLLLAPANAHLLTTTASGRRYCLRQSCVRPERPSGCAQLHGGAVQRVWDTGPTSKNRFSAATPEVCFEHLWEQMHACKLGEDLPLLSSPKLLKFKTLLKLITLKTERDGDEHQTYQVQNSS